MTLKEIKDFFKSSCGWNYGISIGQIDKNLSEALCFYNSGFADVKIGTLGGKESRSYDKKSVTVLLRWGRNADSAELKAKEIYDFFDEKNFIYKGMRVFVMSRYDGPIDLGTDDKGIYEYSFEFDFYSKKQ